jgi:hypothetical protein
MKRRGLSMGFQLQHFSDSADTCSRFLGVVLNGNCFFTGIFILLLLLFVYLFLVVIILFTVHRFKLAAIYANNGFTQQARII